MFTSPSKQAPVQRARESPARRVTDESGWWPKHVAGPAMHKKTSRPSTAPTTPAGKWTPRSKSRFSNKKLHANDQSQTSAQMPVRPATANNSARKRDYAYNHRKQSGGRMVDPVHTADANLAKKPNQLSPKCCPVKKFGVSDTYREQMSSPAKAKRPLRKNFDKGSRNPISPEKDSNPLAGKRTDFKKNDCLGNGGVAQPVTGGNARPMRGSGEKPKASKTWQFRPTRKTNLGCNAYASSSVTYDNLGQNVSGAVESVEGAERRTTVARNRTPQKVNDRSSPSKQVRRLKKTTKIRHSDCSPIKTPVRGIKCNITNNPACSKSGFEDVISNKFVKDE